MSYIEIYLVGRQGARGATKKSLAGHFGCRSNGSEIGERAPSPPDSCAWNGTRRMAEKLTDYDPAAALIDDEEIATFLADALETGDAVFIAKS